MTIDRARIAAQIADEILNLAVACVKSDRYDMTTAHRELQRLFSNGALLAGDEGIEGSGEPRAEESGAATANATVPHPQPPAPRPVEAFDEAVGVLVRKARVWGRAAERKGVSDEEYEQFEEAVAVARSHVLELFSNRLTEVPEPPQEAVEALRVLGRNCQPAFQPNVKLLLDYLDGFQAGARET